MTIQGTGNADRVTILAVRAALSKRIDMPRILTEASELAAAATVWNGAVDHQPALIVQCETAAEVQHAVRTAREFGLPLSVRGGGHDWIGRAIRADGLVIDLANMRGVSVHDGIATVSGGATAEDVVAAADQDGLTAATGTVGAVGMTGLTLGGGYGPLCGRFGLAADNLVGADVVLADGEIVHSGGDDNADLLWALQGGGGNFGVVTSIEVALHPLEEVLVGSYTYPFEHVEQVLAGYGELISTAPDDLTAVLSIVPTDEGTPAVVISPTWSGNIADGEVWMQDFAELATPLAVDLSAMSPLTKLRQLNGLLPDGARYAIGTRNISSLTPAVASTLCEAYAARKNPGSFLNVHHFHGKATERAVWDTAFGLRQDHLMIELIETGESVSDWTKTAVSMLADHALPGGYPNLLDPDEKAQVNAAYGRNGPRLVEIKRRFDPRGVFQAIALPT